MFARRLALAIATFAASTSTAFAAAGASVNLSGDGVQLAVSVQDSNATFDVGSFDVSLAPLQTLTETFSYTVKVADDGLPATRDWSFCTPISFTDCGPGPTGFEQAYASIWLGRDGSPTDNDFMISDTSSFVSFQSVTGQPGVYTGTIDYTATNESSLEWQSTTVTILAAAFVDASPVPEPSQASLCLAGLVALGSMARATRRRRVPNR